MNFRNQRHSWQGAIYTFAPAIDQLNGHLFGDIFGRDNLDFQINSLLQNCME